MDKEKKKSSKSRHGVSRRLFFRRVSLFFMAFHDFFLFRVYVYLRMCVLSLCRASFPLFFSWSS